MKNLSANFLKALGFVLESLKVPALFVSIFIIITVAFFIYDRYQTYQEIKLGEQLVKNIKVDNSCRQIVNASQKFDIKFTVNNGNSTDVGLKSIQIDKSLLGVASKKFLGLISIDPSFSATDNGNPQSLKYQFESVKAKPSKTLPITLTLQAGSKQEAGANPHTIVVYSGNIFFNFEHEIIIEAPCEIQVRYAN